MRLYAYIRHAYDITNNDSGCDRWRTLRDQYTTIFDRASKYLYIYHGSFNHRVQSRTDARKVKVTVNNRAAQHINSAFVCIHTLCVSCRYFFIFVVQIDRVCVYVKNKIL